MKRMVVFLLLVFVTGLFCGSGIASEKPVKLKFAYYTQPTTLAGQCAQFVKEEIEQATDGKVKIDIFWGGSLLKGPEILQGVKDGTVEMGHINPNYYPSELAMSGAYATLPQGPSSFKGQDLLFGNIFNKVPELKDELLRHNQIPLFAYTVLPKCLVSTKPVTSLDDLKGRKIRAANRWVLSQLEAVGAIPVSVAWSDCYMALQTGTIDAVFTNLDSIHSTKLDEVAPHIFLAKPLWSGSKFMITVNADTWNSFPKETQDMIMDAMSIVSKKYANLFESTWDEVVKEQIEMGCVVNNMSDEDVKRWVNMPIHEELQNIWIKEQEGKGISNATKIFAQIKDAVQEAIEVEK